MLSSWLMQQMIGTCLAWLVHAEYNFFFTYNDQENWYVSLDIDTFVAITQPPCRNSTHDARSPFFSRLFPFLCVFVSPCFLSYLFFYSGIVPGNQNQLSGSGQQQTLNLVRFIQYSNISTGICRSTKLLQQRYGERAKNGE